MHPWSRGLSHEYFHPHCRIVNVNDLDALYIDPVDDREWGLVHFDITVVPVFRIREAARFDKL